MRRFGYQIAVVLFLVLCVGIALLPSLCDATAQDVTAYELRDGVIVDPTRNLAYVMNPNEGIDAVELSKGTTVWSTKQAAKPLAVGGDLLVGQVEPIGFENKLKIVVLNVKKRGLVFSDSIKLPDNVQVSIDKTLNTSFTTRAKVLGRDVFVSWEYTFQHVTGMAPRDFQALPQTVNGTIKVDLTTRTISSLKPAEVPSGLDPRPPDLSGKERLPDVSGVQFISAGGDHVLSSELTADDRVWDKYRWAIYNSTNGERVAEIRNFQSMAPFCILDTMIIFETLPYMLRGQPEESLKIRAVNLKTGQEIWNLLVRDTSYSGPFPP